MPCPSLPLTGSLVLASTTASAITITFPSCTTIGTSKTNKIQFFQQQTKVWLVLSQLDLFKPKRCKQMLPGEGNLSQLG
jgi:hypothetical protein